MGWFLTAGSLTILVPRAVAVPLLGHLGAAGAAVATMWAVTWARVSAGGPMGVLDGGKAELGCG
jgi:hypothetical protein